MTTFLTDADVRAVHDWPAAVAALRRAYGHLDDTDAFPPRMMARNGNRLWLRILGGVSRETGMMGAKLIAASVNSRRVSYLIPLFDPETVDLVALLDAHSITGFRTAATSALAVDVLAPRRPLQVAMIGSGFEAQNHLRALASARELSAVTVFSPTPSSRERFVEVFAGEGTAVRAVSTPQDAVAGADVVVCAARSHDESPIMHGDWIKPGMTVVSIGSTLPEQRELDASCITQADLVVADQVEEVAHDTGDMIAAKEAGTDFSGKLVSLAAVVSGQTPGRRSEDDVVVYKSVGAAVQDLAVAQMCAERATELGLGTTLPVTLAPITK
ncbi:ornithine cyclodeaminase family protein [Nocardia sp. NPDC051911]|uniref:ornithine cyclodeaminase family protein n=1 Tax=Nocardia sp. NPDC051911 TaxID=3154648 RepID=UPI00342C9173